MSWFKGDDRLHSCPKWAPTSFAARGLWAHANSWVADRLTDGFVPANMLRAWGAPLELAAELVDAQLWDLVEGGYRFHNWLKYNPSAEKVLADRRKGTERKSQWRLAHASGEAEPRHSNASRAPVPDPDPRRIKEDSSAREAFGLRPLASTMPELAAKGAAWLAHVTRQEAFSVSGKWAKPLEELALKPQHEKAAAAAILAAQAANTIGIIQPQHVVDYWHLYREGKAPGQKSKPAAVASPAGQAYEDSLRKRLSELGPKLRKLVSEDPHNSQVYDLQKEISETEDALRRHARAS